MLPSTEDIQAKKQGSASSLEFSLSNYSIMKIKTTYQGHSKASSCIPFPRNSNLENEMYVPLEYQPQLFIGFNPYSPAHVIIKKIHLIAVSTTNIYIIIVVKKQILIGL